jgi:cob(I)alamin adenosyltransferase
LLKSLIALEIDQSQLSLAKKNIKRLKKSVDYLSDAEYFTGEVMEAEGDIQNALLSYKKVKSGSLLKRAQQKILVLTRDIGKKQASQKVNYKKAVINSERFDE